MPTSPDPRTYGHIPGVRFGRKFKNRDGLIRAGVHAQSQAGIHGDSGEDGGAFSICISEGYEDNRDMGETIIYVGSGTLHTMSLNQLVDDAPPGGQNSRGEQIADQTFDDPPNKALKISCDKGRFVRVVRGKNKSSFYAPASGYRYDGLYLVTSAEMRPGKQGYKMCFFELRRHREEGDGPLPNRRLLTLKKMANMRRKTRNR